MADILKISTPLVDKTPIAPNKPAVEADTNFNLAELSKVIQTNAQSEMLRQNTGNIDQPESPSILLNLMKDPSVTAGFLKNIYMLEEIIKLLPVNNNAFTKEIQQLFDSLLLSPDDIVGELKRQENTSTAFKGELFDFMREIVQNERPEMRSAMANLLKAINGIHTQRSVLDSVSNNLLFLAESVRPSATLSQKLESLAMRFRSGEAGEGFEQLKQEALSLAKDVEGSILYTPKLEKILPMLIYNLSRYSDNPNFLRDATSNVLMHMDGEAPKSTLVDLLYKLVMGERQPQEQSRVMDVLAKLLERESSGMARQLSGAADRAQDGGEARQQSALHSALMESGWSSNSAFGADSLFGDWDKALLELDSKGMLTEKQLLEQQYQADVRAYGPEKAQELRAEREEQLSAEKAKSLHLLNSDKIDKIVHSLLSSPCNFTPLLHFIIPVMWMDIRSFAELWIDPNDEDSKKSSGSADAQNVHMLIVFDIEGIGRFEAELFTREKDITLNLYCPPAYTQEFSGISDGLARAVVRTGYRFKSINVTPMQKSRSLMEVFKTLPHRRTGIDVKI